MTPDQYAKLDTAYQDLMADYLKLKRENTALRDEIHILRQMLPTVGQALRESLAEFVDAFVEI